MKRISVSGKTILVSNVNSIKHNLDITLTSDTITDFSDIKVSRYGKNLFKVGTKANYVSSGGTINFSSVENNIITSINQSGNAAFLINTLNKFVAGTYTMSALFEDGMKNRVVVRCLDGNGNILTSSDIRITGMSYVDHYKGWCADVNPLTVNIPDTVAFWNLGFVFFNSNKEFGPSTLLTIRDVQVESGNVATPYEPYVESQTVIANADGTVNGLTSVSPNMTLLTDRYGAVINLIYNANTRV